MQRLDAIDKRLLSVLQRDGRISVSELADEVGMSPSTCLRRLRQLEETELIKRYVAILDPDAVGFPISVFVSVKLSKQPYSEASTLFTKEVARWSEVVNCWMVSGPVDYLLRVVAADIPSFERFLKTRVRPLEYVASLESSFCLDSVKSTTALPII
jgi:Lrp/AsnC family leucine-responsive transcriptional regulator